MREDIMELTSDARPLFGGSGARLVVTRLFQFREQQLGPFLAEAVAAEKSACNSKYGAQER
jgi:hypothetical protein